MPWCPKCKCEYRKGITVCADCNVELVEDLSALKDELDTLLLTAEPENEALAVHFEKFLQYSEIPSKLIKNEEGQYEVYTSSNRFSDAKRCFQAFYAGESQRAAEEARAAIFQTDDTGEEDGESDSMPGQAVPAPQEFKSAVARYEDYRSSAYAFSTIGALGVLFALLNLLNILPWFNIFTSLVMVVMFGIFLAFGVVSFAKMPELKVLADNEAALAARAKDWLKNNITPDTISKYRLQLNVSNASQYGMSEDLLEDVSYLGCLEMIRRELLRAVPELDPAHAEQLVDEYYDDTFSDEVK